MLADVSSKDTGIKIVAAAGRVSNNDAHGFAIVEVMRGAARGFLQKR
jgi:hypothetical protein